MLYEIVAEQGRGPIAHELRVDKLARLWAAVGK
jgi:hypothetical protein